MDGQPDGVGIGISPVHAMLLVSGDVEIIAGLKRHDAVVGKSNPGRAAKEKHPLVLRLVIPEPFFGAMASRHDALDASRLAFGQDLNEFSR